MSYPRVIMNILIDSKLPIIRLNINLKIANTSLPIRLVRLDLTRVFNEAYFKYYSDFDVIIFEKIVEKPQ